MIEEVDLNFKAFLDLNLDSLEWSPEIIEQCNNYIAHDALKQLDNNLELFKILFLKFSRFKHWESLENLINHPGEFNRFELSSLEFEKLFYLALGEQQVTLLKWLLATQDLEQIKLKFIKGFETVMHSKNLDLIMPFFDFLVNKVDKFDDIFIPAIHVVFNSNDQDLMRLFDAQVKPSFANDELMPYYWQEALVQGRLPDENRQHILDFEFSPYWKQDLKNRKEGKIDVLLKEDALIGIFDALTPQERFRFIGMPFAGKPSVLACVISLGIHARNLEDENKMDLQAKAWFLSFLLKYLPPEIRQGLLVDSSLEGSSLFMCLRYIQNEDILISFADVLMKASEVLETNEAILSPELMDLVLYYLVMDEKSPKFQEIMEAIASKFKRLFGNKLYNDDLSLPDMDPSIPVSKRQFKYIIYLLAQYYHADLFKEYFKNAAKMDDFDILDDDEDDDIEIEPQCSSYFYLKAGIILLAGAVGLAALAVFVLALVGVLALPAAAIISLGAVSVLSLSPISFFFIKSAEKFENEKLCQDLRPR